MSWFDLTWFGWPEALLVFGVWALAAAGILGLVSLTSRCERELEEEGER